MGAKEGGGDWYFNFARNLNDWVLDYVERLLLQLQGSLGDEGVDFGPAPKKRLVVGQ
ncbi:hypothetical protein CK203_055897 [Vitis vinifera]|uniref:Uncharacterized protein n=1 Tax=Vitis vinifera TaxID=29760 RepID=A0A438FTV4_VITVI|nr:hypothetical protein CK203_055897 [Vitis vinifera]